MGDLASPASSPAKPPASPDDKAGNREYAPLVVDEVLTVLANASPGKAEGS